MNLNRGLLRTETDDSFVYASSMSSSIPREYFGTIDTFLSPSSVQVDGDIKLNHPTIVQGLNEDQVYLANRSTRSPVYSEKGISTSKHTVLGRIIAASLLLLGILTCSVACAYYVLAIYGVLV